MKTLEQLAREAGFSVDGAVINDGIETAADFAPALARFRSLCRAEAMEEAAQLCERYQEGGIGGWKHNTPADCAAAIREMK